MLLGRVSRRPGLATLLLTAVTISSCRSSCPASFKKMTDTPAAVQTSTTTPYKAGSASIAYVTAPSADVAKTLAHGLLEQHLAACINIVPGITSIYRWDGAVQEDTEVLMMIKTETQRVDAISKYVRDHHPYDVAEVISVPIENGNAPYMEFLAKAMKKDDV